MYNFRWNDWNRGHIAEHGVTPVEAEQVIRRARPPYPESVGEGKYRVWGQSEAGEFLQAVFIIDPDERLYVMHARPLTDREKRRLRRRRR